VSRGLTTCNSNGVTSEDFIIRKSAGAGRTALSVPVQLVSRSVGLSSSLKGRRRVVIVPAPAIAETARGDE